MIRIAETRSQKALSSEVRPEYLPPRTDSLQRVQLEAAAIAQSQRSTDPMYMRHIRRLPSDAELWATGEMAGFVPKPRLRLGNGSIVAAAIEKVTAIDQVRNARGKVRH